MTLNQLGLKLNEMYCNAKKGEAVAMIHLFGITYASEINKSKLTKKEIILKAGIPTSYITELSKGIKLSKFVIPKSD